MLEFRLLLLEDSFLVEEQLGLGVGHLEEHHALEFVLMLVLVADLPFLFHT
jgi:hypothetical protein